MDKAFNKINKAVFEEMVFALGKRSKGIVSIGICTSNQGRKKAYYHLTSLLEEYQHDFIDFEGHEALTSRTENDKELKKDRDWPLYEYVKLLLKDLHSSTSTYPNTVIHILGLETLFYTKKRRGIDIASINMERELLFGLPCITILWLNPDTFSDMKMHAPDIIDWISDVFEFRDDRFEPDFHLWNLLPPQLPGLGFWLENSTKAIEKKKLEATIKNLEKEFPVNPLTNASTRHVANARAYWQQIGILYFTIAQWHNALEAFMEVEKLPPISGIAQMETKLFIAGIQKNLGNHKVALEYYQAIITSETTSIEQRMDALFGQTESYLALRDFEKALSALDYIRQNEIHNIKEPSWQDYYIIIHQEWMAHFYYLSANQTRAFHCFKNFHEILLKYYKNDDIANGEIFKRLCKSKIYLSICYMGMGDLNSAYESLPSNDYIKNSNLSTEDKSIIETFLNYCLAEITTFEEKFTSVFKYLDKTLYRINVLSRMYSEDYRLQNWRINLMYRSAKLLLRIDDKKRPVVQLNGNLRFLSTLPTNYFAKAYFLDAMAICEKLLSVNPDDKKQQELRSVLKKELKRIV